VSTHPATLAAPAVRSTSGGTPATGLGLVKHLVGLEEEVIQCDVRTTIPTTARTPS